MQESGLNSVRIEDNKQPFILEISSLCLSNYSNSDIIVTVANQPRTIPAFDPALKVPYYFRIEGDGTFSKIEIKVAFVTPGKTGYALLDYRTKICK